MIIILSYTNKQGWSW